MQRLLKKSGNLLQRLKINSFLQLSLEQFVRDQRSEIYYGIISKSLKNQSNFPCIRLSDVQTLGKNLRLINNKKQPSFTNSSMQSKYYCQLRLQQVSIIITNHLYFIQICILLLEVIIVIKLEIVGLISSSISVIKQMLHFHISPHSQKGYSIASVKILNM